MSIMIPSISIYDNSYADGTLNDYKKLVIFKKKLHSHKLINDNKILSKNLWDDNCSVKLVKMIKRKLLYIDDATR